MKQKPKKKLQKIKKKINKQNKKGDRFAVAFFILFGIILFNEILSNDFRFFVGLVFVFADCFGRRFN